MKYCQLGYTDIKISLIALGTMTFGEQNTESEIFEQIDYAFAQGVNIIDVAELYPIPPKRSTFGDSERMVGRWLVDRGLREKIILASKVTGNSSRNPGVEHVRNGAHLSEAQIKLAIEGSLKRLQTDYLDLYQLHWPERNTNFFGRLAYKHNDNDGESISLEESLSTLNTLIQEGKIRHYGLSNETPWGIMESCRVANKLGIPRPVSIQNPYNLLNRTYEIGMAEISMREKIGCLAYSPLAFGILSGKYCQGERPENTRLSLFSRFTRYSKPYAEEATQAYTDLAKEHQLDPAKMAIAFVNQQQFVNSTIIGATTMAQLKNNIDSLQLTLNHEVICGIETIHNQYCNPAP